MKKQTKVAAIQLATKIGDSKANIASCERLALMAVKKEARWIALPEFFTTGVSWNTKIVEAIQNIDGTAANFMRDFSAKHQIVLGGSFLCRLSDGSVRNRYQCYVNGSLIGQHDKDLPTMWENYFYEGGDPADSGMLGTYDNTRIGAAVCWEFMRTMTARRLRKQVDVIMGGSCWWSIPTNFPVFLQKLWEPANNRCSLAAIQDSARLIGAPVIHAAHCGEIECPMPGLPINYRGFFEGNAAIVDASGKILAHLSASEGEGIVCAEISLGAQATTEEIPPRFWLRSRGFLPAFAWHHQRWLGRRWYKRNVFRK
ncbi:nitrilase/cyanide hydratase and apolipoprotein n-acyltransferase [hydrocarbon metagenome]|uniref:Nitrilase/cyanide hydratase and apolipoprotein n-acyltransferase n=1 Tax=hydrocarbon metagenome TaxID=938273 RepID=A0A0W8FNC4_9ZZZZ